MIKISSLLLVLCLPVSLQAANPEVPDILTEDDYLADIPIVLSASRLSQPQTESATTVTVITRDMIDASSANSIPELMRLVPGFQVGYYDGNIPVVTYHGMSGIYSRRIQVLIDGRSVYIPTYGGVPWKSLPVTLDEIEQIEVTRGPNAAAYGSNSFLAVISIKTFNAFDTQGNYLNIINGNNKQHQLLYRVGGQTDNADFRVTLGHRGDKGYDDFADDYDENLLKVRVDYTLGNNSHLSYQAGTNENTQLEQGAGSSVTHDFITSFTYHQIKWEKNIDDKSSISVQYFLNDYIVDNKSLSTILTGADIGYPGFGIDDFQITLDNSSEAIRQDVEFNYFYKPNASLRTVSGFSYRYDSVKSARLFNTSQDFTTDISRLFGHAEWTITPSFIFNAGLMIEDHEISDISYSPRLALIHKLDKNQSIRFSYSNATRAPSTVEESVNITYYPSLTISGTGICTALMLSICEPGTDDVVAFPIYNSPGGLDFEQIESSEIGFFGDYLQHKINLSAKLFHDVISDIIVDRDGDGDFRNSQGVISNGLELDLSYKPDTDLTINFTYANIKLEDKTQDGYSTFEVFADTAPEESFGFTVLKQFNQGYSVSLEYFDIGEMRWADIGTPVAGYDILNIKLSKKVKFQNSTLRTSLVLRNLSGEYNDYNEYKNIKDLHNSTMSKRISLELELLNF